MPAPKKKGGEDPHLHDFFAGLAMMSLIVVYKDDNQIVREYAKRAYEIADVMIDEKERRATGDDK